MKLNKLKNTIKKALKELNEQRRSFGPDSPLKPLNCDKFWHNPQLAQDCCKACKHHSPLQMTNSSCLKYCHCCDEYNINEQTGTGQYWQYNIGACFDWGHNWVATTPFTNPANPNNPCNHICSRITHWQTQSQNSNDPKRISRLKCKIQHGLVQYNIHGCSSVTSNFCPL